MMASSTALTPDEYYARLVVAFMSEPKVSLGVAGKKGLGASALRINTKIFAMLVNCKLVVKLPRQRVDALIAAGAGERFDPGHGRLMKEWIALEPCTETAWRTLAREVHAFVATQR